MAYEEKAAVAAETRAPSIGGLAKDERVDMKSVDAEEERSGDSREHNQANNDEHFRPIAFHLREVLVELAGKGFEFREGDALQASGLGSESPVAVALGSVLLGDAGFLSHSEPRRNPPIASVSPAGQNERPEGFSRARE